MPAQSGASVLLSYGPQGTQQAGGSLVLAYQAPVTRRRLSAGVAAPWSASALLRVVLRAPYSKVTQTDQTRAAPWSKGEGQDARQAVPWGRVAELDAERRAPWVDFGKPAQPETGLAWGVAQARDREAAGPWGRYEATVDPISAAPWVRSARRDREAAGPWTGPMVELRQAVVARFRASRPLDQVDRSPWAFYSRRLAPGWGVVIPDGSSPEPGDNIIVPIRRVYLVINDVFLRRVDDSTRLHTPTLRLAVDRDSWTYTWSASLAIEDRDAVMPDTSGDPVLVEASINGQLFRLVVDDVASDRTHPSKRVSVSGRGWSAVLDDESAISRTYNNDEARTAEQLMNEALTVNGVSLGWSVESQLTDWLIPGGVWSHQGTPISALKTIAASVGGYVQPHPTGMTVRVLHPFPVAPWAIDTVTPDFVLPSSAVDQEGLRWVRRPAYNRVFVSGQKEGRRGQVTRAGSAGDVLAAPVVDPLLTHVDASRQRGIAELGKGGNMVVAALRLQVLPETSVIHPGKVLQYVVGSGSSSKTYRGYVRGCVVDYSWPKLRQALTVDAYEMEAP